MYDRKILTAKIIKALLDEREVKLSRLSAITGVGRDTLAGELESLLATGMLERIGVGYRIGKRSCALILRVSEGEGRITVYDGASGAVDRYTVPFSFAVTSMDNILLACSALNNYRNSLVGGGREAVCCFAYDDTVGKIGYLPDIFVLKDRTEDIVARVVGEDEDGACMFVSDVSFMCAGKRSVSVTQRTPEDVCSYISELIDAVRPHRLVFEGAESERVAALCESRKLKREVWSLGAELTPAERDMIARGVAELTASIKRK